MVLRPRPLGIMVLVQEVRLCSVSATYDVESSTFSFVAVSVIFVSMRVSDRCSSKGCIIFWYVNVLYIRVKAFQMRLHL